jgi:LmbE family N-acetylglucosaminyl deacetylase
MAETALVIAAHPNDGEFGAAGYCIQLAAKGRDVYFLIATNGAKGTEDRNMPRERLIALRREEQREACRRLGVKDVFFLDHEDSELVYDRGLLEEVVRYIRMLKPYAAYPRPARHHHPRQLHQSPGPPFTGHGGPRRCVPHGARPPEFPRAHG